MKGPDILHGSPLPRAIKGLCSNALGTLDVPRRIHLTCEAGPGWTSRVSATVVLPRTALPGTVALSSVAPATSHCELLGQYSGCAAELQGTFEARRGDCLGPLPLSCRQLISILVDIASGFFETITLSTPSLYPAWILSRNG